MKTVAEINITPKAKKKIQGIAKNNNLDFDFTYYLLSLCWNYDGIEGSWAGKLDKDAEYIKRQNFLCQKLNISEAKLDKNQIIEQLLEKLKTTDNKTLINKFAYGAANKNNCLKSEYASYHYLRNATAEKLHTLDWRPVENNADIILDNLFNKVFRAGAIGRYSLAYLYADLVIPLPYLPYAANANNWIPDFINDVKNKTGKTSLTDLRTLLKPYCKGDKYELQTILEALSYAGLLKVDGHPVENIFIPDCRDKLSEHFYSNEWTYPLRFWTQNQ